MIDINFAYFRAFICTQEKRVDVVKNLISVENVDSN